MTATATANRLTPQQQAALEARDRSVSLSAGAGCGKTFVLTERFIADLDPGAADEAAQLDSLIAITFTDAAAREMRDRIRRRCFDRMRTAADAAEASAWQRLMRSIDAARISTIHSFCGALLRAHAVEAGLDPQFEVLDPAAAELLRLETVDDRLRTLLDAGQEDVLNLAAKRGLENLRDDVAQFAGARMSEVIQKWRTATAEEIVETWDEFFQREAASLARRQLRTSSELAALGELADPELASSDKLRAHLAALAAELKRVDDAETPVGETLRNLRELARVQGVCTKKDWRDAADYERFRDASKALRECIDKSVLKKTFDREASLEAAAIGLSLVHLAADVADALEAAKARRNQLEFDDLLVRAHRLLTEPANAAIREQAVRGTRLMMVDEFQDTNPLQAAIVKAFCGDDWRARGLFAVGDFKQSIYRFNGAEPEVSNDLRRELPPGGRLSLTTNFRSQPAILHFVNAVFCEAFTNYEPLEGNRPQMTAPPAIEFLWTNQCPDEEQPASDADEKANKRVSVRDARAMEATMLAGRLAEMLRSAESVVVDADTQQPRPLRLGDIAILLRSLSDAPLYEEALRQQGLDYYLAGGHAFYAQQEIYDVANLLRAVDSSVDEIALAGALRSPLFALADETLFWMVRRRRSLNQAIASASPMAELSADEAGKLGRAARIMARLRSEKDRLLVAELLGLAIELTGYDAVLQCEFLGPRKLANLEKLVEQARVHDRTSPGDLQGFITQLSEFVVRAPKEALAATQTEGDAIRMMTIHYSKGLEFPLVVLADLERKRHSGDSRPVLHEELGPLVRVESDGVTGFKIYQWLEDIEDLEERKRLFYVGCTRAADYLILSSCLKDPAKPTSDWLQLVDQTLSLADGSLRRSLPAGWEAPRIRVTRALSDERPAEAPGGRSPDLRRLVAKTQELATGGAERLPRSAATVPVNNGARRRFSFSQLTGALRPVATEELADEVNRDAPLLGRTAGGLELGSLVHGIFERLDFSRPREAAEISGFLAPQFCASDPAGLASRAATMAEGFFDSPRAAALAEAKVLRREVDFSLPWPPAGGGASGRYLLGRLDCLYQGSDGRWRLLDYKTNRVAGDSVELLIEQYELQMLCYWLACEQALNEPLAECVLVLLDGCVEHAYEWDERSRQRGIECISEAIDSIVASTVAAKL